LGPTRKRLCEIADGLTRGPGLGSSPTPGRACSNGGRKAVKRYRNLVNSSVIDLASKYFWGCRGLNEDKLLGKLTIDQVSLAGMKFCHTRNECRWSRMAK
jgi:hypothetical protein